MICDLDTRTVNAERAAIYVVEFFVWWEQAGRVFYHDDDGLKALANDAVSALGGWRAARRVLREMDQRTLTLIEGKGGL